MIVRSIAAFGLAALLTAAAVRAQPAPPPEWDIRCGPSPFEVATDCVAGIATDNVRLRIVTQQGQLRLTLDHLRCGSAQRNYDRATLLAMTEDERLRMLTTALTEMSAQTSKTCVQPTPFDLDLTKIPDLVRFPLTTER